MPYPTKEILILKAVHSKFMDRVLRKGELVEIPDIESARWMESGYAMIPPSRSHAPEFCAFIVKGKKTQCDQGPGYGPNSLYCKSHAKKVIADGD